MKGLTKEEFVFVHSYLDKLRNTSYRNKSLGNISIILN